MDAYVYLFMLNTFVFYLMLRKWKPRVQLFQAVAPQLLMWNKQGRAPGAPDNSLRATLGSTEPGSGPEQGHPAKSAPLPHVPSHSSSRLFNVQVLST